MDRAGLSCVLGVAASNTAATRLYYALGYIPTGEQRETRWGDTEVTMAKPLL